MFHLVIVQIDDLCGHEVARDERHLRELQRQPKRAEAIQDRAQFVLAAIALMHVRLEANRVDRDAGREALLDELRVLLGEQEVVEHEPRRRVRLARGVEREANHFDAPKRSREWRDRVRPPR